MPKVATRSRTQLSQWRRAPLQASHRQFLAIELACPTAWPGAGAETKLFYRSRRIEPMDDGETG
jgi:hypothetical protein